MIYDIYLGTSALSKEFELLSIGEQSPLMVCYKSHYHYMDFRTAALSTATLLMFC
jgi:hypothetical protein